MLLLLRWQLFLLLLLLLNFAFILASCCTIQQSHQAREAAAVQRILQQTLRSAALQLQHAVAAGQRP
jgi:starvation-inducible outer membrane lipoprotein